MSKLTVAKHFAITRWFNHYSSRDELLDFQERMIIKHFAFVKSRSAFFHKMPNINSMRELQKLPLMDKSIMMNNFDDLNTVRVKKSQAMRLAINSERTRDFNNSINGISVGLSSGTSGHAGIFLISKEEREAWAGAVLAKLLPPNNLFGHRVAFFLRANNNLYETVNSPLLTFKYFDIYDDMQKNIEQLENFKPTIIVAPPSVLGIIADSIEFKELSISPTKIISVAEVLELRYEKRLSRIFNQKMFQAYQCTEGFLGYTCNSGSIHLNEDIAIFEKEFIDKNRFIPIITDFRRKSQPIIRYRLNDILIQSNEVCSCGSVMQVINRIEGREDDIFIFIGENENQVQVFPDMIARCMLYSSGFNEYRVVQTSHARIEVFLDRQTSAAKDSIEKEFIKLAHKLSFEPPSIIYKNYKYDFTKKLKRIERKF